MKLDLSKYQKIAEDKDTVTMKNDEGHSMQFLMKKLTPIQREQMKRLKLCSGGEVKHYAGGTPGGPISSDSAEEAPSGLVNTGPASEVTSGNLAETPKGLPPEPAQASQMSPEQQGAPNVGPTPPPDLNTELARRAQGSIDDLKKLNAQGVDEYNYFKNKNDELHDYLWGKQVTDPQTGKTTYQGGKNINPNHWAENQSVPQKLASAFGLLMGGLSAGQGGTNPAMDFINNQINRDIDAQKTDIDNKKSLLGYYSQLYGHGNTSLQLARANLLDIYNRQMDQTAASIGTPQAIKAQQAYDQWTQNQKDIALKSAASSSIAEDRNKKNAAILGGVSSQILRPGADQRIDALRQLATHNPAMAQILPQILQEYNNAKQGERGLATMDDVYPKLKETAGLGSFVLKRLSPLKEVAKTGAEYAGFGAGAKAAGALGGGAAAAEGAAGAATAGAAATGAAGAATLGIPAAIAGAAGLAALGAGGWKEHQKISKFEAHKSLLKSALSSSLAGIPIGGGEGTENILDTITPEYGDQEDVYGTKMHTGKDYIRSHIKTPLLEKMGLAYPYKP